MKTRSRIFQRRINERVYDPNEELQNFFDLSQEDFVRLIGMVGGERKVPSPPEAVRAIENLREIKASLEAQFEPEEIQRWLHSPNPIFDGKTPLGMIAGGETDRVLEVLIRLEEGIHN